MIAPAFDRKLQDGQPWFEPTGWRVFTGTRVQVEATHSSSVLLLKMDGRHGTEIGDTRHASIQRKTPQAIL